MLIGMDLIKSGVNIWLGFVDEEGLLQTGASLELDLLRFVNPVWQLHLFYLL